MLYDKSDTIRYNMAPNSFLGRWRFMNDNERMKQNIELLISLNFDMSYFEPLLNGIKMEFDDIEHLHKSKHYWLLMALLLCSLHLVIVTPAIVNLALICFNCFCFYKVIKLEEKITLKREKLTLLCERIEEEIGLKMGFMDNFKKTVQKQITQDQAKNSFSYDNSREIFIQPLTNDKAKDENINKANIRQRRKDKR